MHTIAIANGQYLLIRRSIYEALGGYDRPDLRGTLLDDLDLARLVKREGYRLRFVDGRDMVRVRMYEGLGEAWRGWRKNAFLGSRGGVTFALLQLIGLPVMTIFPFLLPLLMLNKRTRSSRADGTGAAAGLSVLGESQYAGSLVLRLHPPLAGGVFAGILAQSTWQVLTGKGVDWRGRRYYVRPQTPSEKPL